MKPKVMVVEDTPDLAEVLIHLLESQGYDVVHAAEGKSAIEMAKAEKPQLMLLDLMIPELNGFHVCRIVHNQPETCNIKILVMSSLFRKNDIMEAYNAGAAEYIVKPFDTNRLMELVRIHVNGYH